MKVLKFYADWCGPCKAYAPTFEAFKEAHPEIDCESIDIDKNQELAQKHGIKNIPATLFLFGEHDDYGIPKTKLLKGSVTKGQLERTIEQ